MSSRESDGLAATLVTLAWEDGAKLVRQSTLQRGEDGRSVLIGSFDIPLTLRKMMPARSRKSC
jgi:hypothetical protein